MNTIDDPRRPPQVALSDIPHRTSSRKASAKATKIKRTKSSDESKTHATRTITPDSPSSTTHVAASSDNGRIRSPTSETSSTNASQNQPDHSASVSNTDEEGTIARHTRHAKTKSRSQDEGGSDASPKSFVSKARKRLGSITTTSTFIAKPDESNSLSTPVLQSLSAREQGDNYFQVPRTPRRTFSPDTSHFPLAGSVRSPMSLDSDSNRILHLMKTTCGRMHGILFFRPLHTTAWASGYCAINVAPGSLVCQVKGDLAMTKTLISDLRGCSVRTHYDPETQSTYLSVVVTSSGAGYQLRPPVPETFESWLAALLCWQPLNPKGIHNKMMKPQRNSISDRRPTSQRRISDVASSKSTTIVKVGKMLLLEAPFPTGPNAAWRQEMNQHSTPAYDPWRRVSATLHENGILKLFGDHDGKILLTISLIHFSRCAIQRLDESLLERKFCIAISPQYALHGGRFKESKSPRPVILCFETNIAFEAWYVLLKALTIPELYGPEEALSEVDRIRNQDGQLFPVMDKDVGMFRIERTITCKITEVKLDQMSSEQASGEASQSRAPLSRMNTSSEDMYVEIELGKDLRARTAPKPRASAAFWGGEFVLTDLPPVLSKIQATLKTSKPGEREWTMVAHDSYDLSRDANYLSGIGTVEITSHDPVLGQVEVQIEELEAQGTTDKWWTLIDNKDQVAGKILMKLSLQETIVLLSREYDQLSTILHTFSNGLTSQLSLVLGTELKPLSDVLLDIFQASDMATEWINNLIEEEIDGIYKETPPLRMRFSGRIQSNDSYESAEQRELLVRDLSRSATMEANLLFRGNSLVTKALDTHMKRLGGEYLEQTLGKVLRLIVYRDLDCEVDPTKIRYPDQMDRNWVNLINFTTMAWTAISQSVNDCPIGLRVIFKHIRSCAEDRYGSFIRTVRYTSVTGFLFLRFFCAAILNPQLFGLLRDRPPEKSRRTFTLIAKSLNGLANMSKIGSKEVWMEPMNKFLVAATPELKNFIEQICAIPSVHTSNGMNDPQYTASNQVKNRLSASSREGLPSLPFLIDQTKTYAELVDMWVRNVPQTTIDLGVDRGVQKFHNICTDIHQRTSEYLKKAEQAEQPDRKLEHKWQQMLREQQPSQPDWKERNSFDQTLLSTSPDHSADITALPQPTANSYLYSNGFSSSKSRKASEQHYPIESTLSHSTVAGGGSWEQHRPTTPGPYPTRATGHSTQNHQLQYSHHHHPMMLMNSNNSSTASFEAADEHQLSSSSYPQPPKSRDGPTSSSKNRIKDFVNSSHRKLKGKGAPLSGNVTPACGERNDFI